MSCAERVETQKRVWTWCKKWGIPYPCRRVRTQTSYQYEFHQTRYVPSWFPFWEKQEGCCERVVYEWKRAVWWNTPKPYDWVYHDPSVIKNFQNQLDTNGVCPPREGAGAGGGVNIE
ncbi:hypothetical protein [Rheinheimera salexigens]|nr:hypothetical protein [Rheinheimera salexigens]